MKDKILTVLSLGHTKHFISNYTGKICFGLILSGTAIMLFKKGFFVALEFIGSTTFVICLLFVIITHKLNIYAHQQEKIRANYKQRVHQRLLLLLILTIIIVFLGLFLLFHHPYAFLFF